MYYHHQREFLNRGDLIRIACSQACKIWLLDDVDYADLEAGLVRRMNGRRHPLRAVQLTVAARGYWNLLIEAGEPRFPVSYSLELFGHDGRRQAMKNPPDGGFSAHFDPSGWHPPFAGCRTAGP
ncbi:DUF1883 domain-containing protein [Microvirgula aerodenitrificans]|uniref:DUF1883 domain-containing protein n=1 Tax=Microvirgula aerodenitrificans TaxID=57480 RepID=UPI002F3FD265